MALDASEVSTLEFGVNNSATLLLGDGSIGLEFDF